MDYDDNSLNSIPTVAGGARRPDEPYEEPSLGSAPTMVGQGVPGAALGQIDQYQLVRKLGGGGFGVVYLARDTVSGVDVALKTLHPLLKSNLEEMEALRTKFALVSRLSHTNIASPLVLHPVQRIAITDDGVRNEMRLSPGDFIMVMRYAPGVTLSKWRRQFPGGIVPLDQALEIVRQVASALDYAHGEKIVHRDIKPANIMVETIGDGESHTEAQRHREDGAKLRVRILDFGLAAEIRSSMSRISTETGDTSGTRPYMAPEQWLGRKQDGRTDQYALACVAYELLSGAPPFAGAFETGDVGIMRMTVENDDPFAVENVPDYVNEAFAIALAKNPQERFGSCSEFVESCGGRASSPSAPHAAETALDDLKKATRTHEDTERKEATEHRAWFLTEFRAHLRRRIWLWVSVFVLLIGLIVLVQVRTERRAIQSVAFNEKGQDFFYGSNGCPQDYVEAVKWYRKAAEQGNVDGQANLGWMYENGHGVPQDHAEAMKWYRKAADQGHAYAQASLGFMYGTGRGVPQDYAKAVKWYRKAADQGNALGQKNLGAMYANGHGVPQDYAEAVKWYRKAADQGYADGQANLGWMYENGHGVAQSDAEAVKWYRKAADQGNADAQVNLGWMYEKGRGVAQDFAEAVKWYRKAADQGNAFGQNNLGFMYEKGRGVPQDYAEAVKWYRKAADQGDEKARKALKRLGK